MNTAISQTTSPTVTSEHLHAAVMESMIQAALLAAQGLRAMGIGVLSVTVHGARPVIDIAPETNSHKLNMFNTKEWQSHTGKCPFTERTFTQYFVEYRQCLITWVKWR